mmetsp:Transcript_16763/g.45656  ORF Transcript_16763/g.45656 Transcript_16763/m.45656 type:complete len:105 (+) Transcript_16763:76-390(+)
MMAASRMAAFVSIMDIPPELVLNADHTGIMYVQLKGGTWNPFGCAPSVDCWWGWRDEGFREFIHHSFPYIQLLFVPARCTPVAQPNDCGVISILKGEFFFSFEN